MASLKQNTPPHSTDPDDLNDPLICAICTEPYDDDTHQAKFLSCHHTFCSHCLTDLSKKQDNPRVIPCPNCRQLTTIPDGGVAGLQKNFYIENIKEISKKTEQQIKNICHKHGSRLLFFCETCKTVICRDCTVLDHEKSSGHVIKDIAEADGLHRQALLLNMNKKQISLEEIKGNLKELKLEMELLTAAKEANKGKIKEFVQLAYKMLEERQATLMKQNEEQFNAIWNILLSKQSTMRAAITILSKTLKHADKMVKTGTLEEIIAIKQNLMDTAEDMQSCFADFDQDKNIILFESNKGIEAFEKSLANLGVINIQSLIPTKVEYKIKEPASAGKTSVMQVEVFNQVAVAVPVIASCFSVEITDPEKTRIQYALNTANNECTVTFTPQMSGLHTVAAMFKGHQLTIEPNQIPVSSNNPQSWNLVEMERAEGHSIIHVVLSLIMIIVSTWQTMEMDWFRSSQLMENSCASLM